MDRRSLFKRALALPALAAPNAIASAAVIVAPRIVITAGIDAASVRSAIEIAKQSALAQIRRGAPLM